MNKLKAYVKLFFDLMSNSNRRKLFLGSEFNRKVMYRKYGILPNHRVNKVAVLIKLNDEEKVHIIEEKVSQVSEN